MTKKITDYDEMPAAAHTARISRTELARIIDFVEDFEDETEQALQMRTGYREVRMLAHLMRNHLDGRLTTPSSLVASSGLSYGTALRALERVIERGLVIKRPRTRTGKTFSLHPSQLLIDEWQEYARRIKTLVGTVFGWQTRGQSIDEYYFGASYMCAQVIRPPTALKASLAITGHLRLLLHADPTFMAMTTLKKQFESLFGVGIKSRALSIDRLREEIYRNAAASRSRYDLVACDLPWFGELAKEGIVLPLDDLLREDRHDLSDFHPEGVQSARWNGVQYGVPVQTTPELLVYRTDLFEDAGLSPPRTAGEALEAAQRLHQPRLGLSGIAWNAGRGTPVGHTFMMVMAAFGQPIIDLPAADDSYLVESVAGEQCRPMLLSDGARDTAEYLLALLDVSPPHILNMSWYERAKSFARGESAMAYCYTLLAALFEHDPGAPAYGRTGYVSHPTGPQGAPLAPLGGYALAIPANLEEARIKPAWTALKNLTSAGATKLYVTNGSTVSPRFSVGGDPEVQGFCPLIPQVDQMARDGLLQIWPRPPIPELPRLVAILGDEIHAMLCGDSTVDAALQAAQNRVDALMRANGRY